MPGWRPWQELRRREHITLEWARLYPAKGTICEVGRGRRIITLDPRLSQVQRNATLSHELIHDEFDLLWHPDTPSAITESGERFVEGESCDRLVPPDELDEFVSKLSEFELVTTWQVAERFFVPIDVALLSLDRLHAGF